MELRSTVRRPGHHPGPGSGQPRPLVIGSERGWARAWGSAEASPTDHLGPWILAGPALSPCPVDTPEGRGLPPASSSGGRWEPPEPAGQGRLLPDLYNVPGQNGGGSGGGPGVTGSTRWSHSPTRLPPVRLLPGVRPQVSREVRRSGEDLPAVPGGERPSGDPGAGASWRSPPQTGHLVPHSSSPGQVASCTACTSMSPAAQRPGELYREATSGWTVLLGPPAGSLLKHHLSPEPRALAGTGWDRLGPAGTS